MTIEKQQRDDGRLIAVAGQSRWGKSEWVKKMINGSVRCVVWDPRGEYISCGFQPVKSISELASALRDCGKGKIKLCYWGRLEDFSAWCELAYHFGMLWPAVIVAEETADVTSPGKAPGEWGELLRKGLYYGNHIYSVTQRPVESDKTVWGNASVLHSHGFVSPDDQLYMAKRLGISVDKMAALKQYEYYEKLAGEPARYYNAQGKPVT